MDTKIIIFRACHLSLNAIIHLEQVRAKALGDQDALAAAIDFLLNNFHECMGVTASGRAAGSDGDEAEEVPACLEDDSSPAVDVLVAMAKR